MKLLRAQARDAGPAAVAPPPPPGLTVDFPAEARRCPHCGHRLRTQKSKTRRVTTLATGTIRVREIRKRCGHCPSAPVAVSAELARLVPPQQQFGYDLIVWVGRARYHRQQQRSEIRAALARRGIQLAAGSVSMLCDRFLRALETLHRHKAPALRAAMAAGYPLHIDATSDHGRGGQFLCLDGWRDWVLNAVRVSSENAAELQPAIEATIADFGPPVATLRDRGRAGAKAVAGCRLEAVPDLVCHFHFLQAVGRQLLDVEYAALRRELRASKVRSGLRERLRAVRGRAGVRPDLAALILWVLEGPGHKDLPYPFALPHRDFYRRCGQFRSRARRWLPGPRSPAERRVLGQVSALLAKLARRTRIRWAVPRLERSWAVFSELRNILRLRDSELPRGTQPVAPGGRGPAATAERLQAIETAAKAYRERLRRQVAAQPPSRTAHRPEALVLKYLDRYQDGLFGHPVARDPAGRVLAVVARTNNVAEHFFAIAKQKLRRRLGRAHLGRDMEDQPAQAALAANLLCPEFVRIVCGTLDRLPQAFAELDRQAIAAATPLQRNNKDAALRKRIRVWEAADRDQFPTHQSQSSSARECPAATEI